MRTNNAPTNNRTMTSIFLAFILSLFYLNFVEGHGYMETPRSRNIYARREGTDGSQNGVPKKEYCEHCINRKTASGSCGIGPSNNYDDWLDSQGKPMQWISQETYSEGQDIIVGGTFTTNHAGHIEVFACPNGANPSPSCFASNPLAMTTDLLHNGPNDKNYPVRGYISNLSDYTFSYQLPSGLTGDKVLIQWRYITANSCHPPGYKDPVLGLQDRGWLRGPNLPACPEVFSSIGVGVPEQFWNCAEVTIADGSPTSPNPPTPNPPTPNPPTPNPPTPNPPTPNPPTPNQPTPTPPTQTPPTSSGYCSWSTPICNSVDSSSWCSGTEERCLDCGGTWCPASGPTPPPVEIEEGYCSWSTPICNGNDSSPWCSSSQIRCEEGCSNGTWCTADGPEPSSPTPPDPPTSGPVYATTTRYWDCSGGACGCAYLPFGPGTDSRPAMCHSNAMFDAPQGNPHGATYYGTAAISQGLGGGDWLAEGCGKCWKVTGTSNAPGYAGTQTTLVLKGTNYCPPENVMCSGNNPHFDISAPGFDVTEYSLSNTCAEREAAESAGFAACGRWLIDSENPDDYCNCSLFNDPVLRAGCENFFSLKWDNSPVLYEEVTCPTELSQLNCWEENGNAYPNDIPQFCASNIDNESPTSPTTTSPTVAPDGEPCGNGNVGNGNCLNDLCCSQYGWCGTSPAHCETLAPVPAPPPTEPTTTSTAGDDSRLIAYLGNWQSCPTLNEVAKYTHIVIAFAVSYTWNASKNNCSTKCDIDEPPICNNASNQQLVAEWQAAGKKIILSFGGAGMGGSWDGDNNDCWEYCFGRETKVVNRLVELVDNMGLDGVDIDYEYFYEDNQNGSGFNKGTEAQNFLKDVTLGLRQKLPQNAEITHAPMDSDAVPGKAYYDILVEVGSSLDFLMPQYYNGITRPVVDGVDGTGSGSNSALSHYTNLVDNMFGGDSTKMVFGFCISDCTLTGSNANSVQAAGVMSSLSEHYSCNGGAFFWVSEHDPNGSWSQVVSAVIEPNAGCSLEDTVAPVLAPIVAPTLSPVTLAPVIFKCTKNKDCNDNDACTKDKCQKKTGKCKNPQKKNKCCAKQSECVNIFKKGECKVFKCKKNKGKCKKTKTLSNCKNKKECESGDCAD